VSAARLPFEPIEQLLARFDLEREPVGHNAKALARLLGVHSRQVYRWRHEGVTHAHADRLLTRVGHHPAEVYPDELWAAGLEEVA
jgi:plasmid maintenance system antidote protein VapI